MFQALRNTVSLQNNIYKNMVPTSVSVKADNSMEAFALLEDIQGQGDLNAFSLLLDADEGSLQVEPEADLLQSCA